MYQPPHFIEDRTAVLQAMISQYPLDVGILREERLSLLEGRCIGVGDDDEPVARVRAVQHAAELLADAVFQIASLQSLRQRQDLLDRGAPVVGDARDCHLHSVCFVRRGVPQGCIADIMPSDEKNALQHKS